MMARKKYDALPAAVRKIIDDNSGEAQSRAFGALFDQLQSQQLAAIKASPGHTVVAPTPAQLAAWTARTQPLVEEWKAATPGGAKLLETFRALLADAKAGR
jgi:TRAP-type C4-dicarboxylate transport system substrate-binding protein